MDLRRNSLLYSLPIVMFVAGIFIGTAVSIWRSAYLYKQTICYLPAVHLQIKQAGFPSGFLKYVCRLRLPVFDDSSVSFNKCCTSCFAAIAFISGVSAAVVITSATMLFGITGILQALALFLPHFIFYIFGYWALYELAINAANLD